ncbi:MAG: adenylate/guanylate cyclase domain-containing protein [Chloroflexota bacterium]|nr:adenylate/guanylate cyclase domain-containing protein [Chloroflexota bacterium]
MTVATPPRTDATGISWLAAILLALPLIGLVVLLARPELDLVWQHQPSHFWLVLLAAAVNAVLAYVTNVAAGRYRDARVVLVSLAFFASTGFLGLHALATPGVLLTAPNVGFAIATPVGLIIASVFAAASASPIAGPRARNVLRLRPAMLGALIVVMVAWAIASILRLPPLDGPPPAREGAGLLDLLAIIAVALYAYAAWRLAQLYRFRGSTVLLSMAVALVLLGEAMVAILISRNWHLSWWEWHVLLLAAFLTIALGARREYRRGGSLTAAFGGLYLEATLARVDRWYGSAIAAVADADARGESTAGVLAELRREGASDDDLALLTKAAQEVRRLDAAFRPYLPGVVAQGIRDRAPGAGRLGGEERQVSVVFADLAGFTSFSETRSPTEVIEMLNDYWGAVVPAIDATGGTIEQFAGDGVMVIFNAAADQSDHARRAARAGLAIVAAGRPLAQAHPHWPIFRVGINTGPAVVGNVGSDARRSFAAIGDTINTAARLMAAGDPGHVVVGKPTWDALGGQQSGAHLGGVSVKGKRIPVEAWRLDSAPPDRAGQI